MTRYWLPALAFEYHDQLAHALTRDTVIPTDLPQDFAGLILFSDIGQPLQIHLPFFPFPSSRSACASILARLAGEAKRSAYAFAARALPGVFVGYDPSFCALPSFAKRIRSALRGAAISHRS